MIKKQITIAIDGYSACGKSTLAKDLAKKLSFIFIDSGAMYRGVALYCLQNNLFDADSNPKQVEIIQALKNITLSFQLINDNNCLLLNGKNVEGLIRGAEVAAVVSKVATIKEVRKKLVMEQQKMGENGGIVMEGRDIGSVVFPNAEFKLFITASQEIRAQRRFLELKSKGIEAKINEISSNLAERDLMDSIRKESPLIQVADAIVMDNSKLTREEQLDFVLNLIRNLV
ncbi:MAG: (d)CMP kinase [Crocinitomicaceae bacterium]|nr:(d)CMP kinase [Crocinitomicaceae bacterium]